MKKFLTPILTVSLFLLWNVSLAQWSQLNGPQGGSISDLLLDATNLYAVTENGGVYKSADGGNNWSLTGSDIVGDDGNSIVKSGTNIVVGSSVGVYLTGNGGTSWSFPGTSPSSVSQLILNGTDILAATDGGVYVSLDDGASWSSLGTGDLNDLISSIAPDGTTLWASVPSDGSNEGLYKSINSGTNWTEVTNVGFVEAGLNFIYVSGSNLLVQSDFGEGIKYTNDGGTTWFDVTGIPDNITAIRELGGNLYAGTLGPYVYESTDAGASWSQYFSLGPVTSVVFDGASNYYAGTSGGVYRSGFNLTDPGAWTPRFTGMKAHTVTALLTDGSDIYAGTSGGIYKSSSGGITWVTKNSGISGKDFLVLSLLKAGSDIYAGTLNGVLKSSDGGDTWIQKNSGLSVSFGIMSMVSAGSDIFALDFLAGIYTSPDGGDNWSSAVGTGYSGAPWSIGSDGTIIYSSGFFGEVVMISSDAGDNWTASSSGITNSGLNFTNQFFYDGSSVYASTGEGMFRSDNGGTSWSGAGSGLSGQFATSFAVDGSDVYAGIDGEGVFVTDNQGVTWTEFNTDLGNEHVTSLAAGSLYAGTKGSSVWANPPPTPVIAAPDVPIPTYDEITSNSVRVTFTGPEGNCDGCTMTYGINTAIPGTDVYVLPHLRAGDVDTGETISLGIGGLSPATEYRFIVVVSNENGDANSGFTVVTTAANSDPSIPDQTFTIDENTNIDELVGDLDASDPDGDALTYTITGGNPDNAFKILNTDDLYVNNKSALDYETNIALMLTVEVDDNRGGTDTGVITINLNDVPDTPVIEDQVFSIDENSPDGTFVATVAASHPNSIPLTYTISTGNTNDAFAIIAEGGARGAISVNNSSELDFEATEQFVLSVTVSDGFETEAADITINLNDVGGSQTITFDPISDKLDGDLPFTVSASASSDFDVSFTIVSGPATISGNEVTLTGAGLVTIRASQPGDEEYSAATDVEQSFCVIPPKPVITVSGIGTSSVSLDIGETYSRRWYLDSEVMFDGTLQTGALNVNQEGVYSVETDVDGCTSERSSDFTLIITALDSKLNADISVYPNPVESTINVQFDQIGKQIVEIALHDLNGKFLMTPTQRTINGHMSLDVNQLDPGFYILMIRSEIGISQIKFNKK